MRKIRSFLRGALWCVGGVLAVVLLAGAGLALRLVSGPIETSVPQSLLDRVVAEAAPGWHVAASGAQLDFSSDDGLSGLKLHDVVLSDRGGHEVVRAPVLGLRFALAASLDPSEALTVREVALTGASVDVTRDESGAFRLALGDLGGEAGDGESDPFAGLAGLDVAALPSLRIEEAEIRYTDLARGTSWQTEKAQLTLTPSQEGLAGSMTMQVAGGIGGAQIDAFHRSGDGSVTATLILNAVRPSRVAALDPMLAPLERIDAPLSGRLTVEADRDGAFRRVNSNLTAGAGSLTLGEAATALESFTAALDCDVAAARCEIGALSLVSDTVSAQGKGSLRQTEAGDIALGLVLADLSAQRGDVQIGAAGSSLTATVDAETGAVEVERLSLGEVAVSGLPDGASARAGRVDVVGRFDPATGTLSLPTLAAEGLRLREAGGVEQSLGQVTAAVTLESETLDIARIVARDLDIAGEGARVRAALLRGGATVDLAAARVEPVSVVLENLNIERHGASASTIAVASLGGAVDLAAQTLTGGKVTLRDAMLAVPELYRAPVSVSSATLDLAAARDGEVLKLALGGAKAVLDGLPATAKGNFALRGDGTALGRVEASLGPVALDRVPRHWPLGVAPGGLAWVSANVGGGQVESLTLAAQFDEARPERDTLDLEFRFADAAVSFVPGMPPITAASGTGKVTLDRLDLKLSGGKVVAAGEGPLLLKGSEFAIADFSPAIPSGQVKLRARGGVRSVLRLLDTEPLGVIAPTGFDIAKAEGHAEVRVLLDLPLADDLDIDDVRFDARAKIRDYNLIEPETALPVEGDLLLVKATGEGLSLQSDARIGGLAARLGYSQGFGRVKPGEPESILTLESFLSLADFARHGLVLDDYLDGLTAMKARIELFGKGAARINADADLTNVALKAEPLGWAKPAGVPATIRLSGFRNPDGAGRIEALSLSGEGLSAEGSIGFARDGAITRANFSRIKLGSVVDTGVIFGRKTNGDAGLVVKGAQLDLRKVFAATLEGEAPGPRGGSDASEMTINLDLGRVFLRDDLAVFDMRGGARLRGGGLHGAQIDGKLNGSAPARLLAERRRTGTAIRLTAPDAGAFLRALGVFDGAYDGALTLDAISRDGASPSEIVGRIHVAGMVVHDAATLGRVLSGGAAQAFLGDLAEGGIAFTKIELPFRGVGPNWRIEDGVAYGPQIGLTLEGGFDVASGALGLNGSVSPAYAINGALGNVPVLGTLLTGGEGGGVFGVTFAVNGDTNEPEVTVNPLSALAPGFLRRIVAEVGKGGTEPAAAGAPVRDR